MNMTPTREQVAKRVAEYVSGQFMTFDSWLSYENELARELLKDNTFICIIDYTIPLVQEMSRWNKQMQGIIAQVGGGARGMTHLVGNIVGEWLGGGETIDQIVDTY